MLSVICFSKDRPLQLDAYLQSLMFYSGLPPQAISVLYADTPQSSYDDLVVKYSAVNWRRETAFRADLLLLIEASADHILFGCDDVFFTNHFDVSDALAHLARDPSLFGFSLRLGLNLHSLPDLTSHGDVIEWNWTTASTGHWSYPWEVSASIYRKPYVLEYLMSTPAATNPNRFESLLATALEAPCSGVAPRLAAFVRSKCLTLTVNRVQDEFPNEFDDSQETDIGALYRAHQAGLQLDWVRQHGVQNKVIHVDAAYFQLCDTVVLPSIDFTIIASNPTAQWLDTRSLRLRIFFWRYVVALKEWLRPHVPRKLMFWLRKLMRMG